MIALTGPKPVLLERDNNVPSLETLMKEVRLLDRTYRDAVAEWRRREGSRAA
ncbi:MAG: hypothetical protein JW751_20315 [Polyangiaceae bacterium]|nr:hypothetical protein [Polyangiaceae bacterium]